MARIKEVLVGRRVRLVVRGFNGRIKVFEEKIDCEEKEFDAIAEEQLKRMIDYPKHMIEIEFLDEPDVSQRFFRFGTDPAGMRQPIAIDLRDPHIP